MTPQELKESIIYSAMKGRLTEQLESDGRSTDYLDAVANYKRVNKINDNKKMTAITTDDIPFDIPETWSWVKFGEIVNYRMGKTPARSESQWWSPNIPWVSISDMPENGHIVSTKESVSAAAVNEVFKNRVSKAGTLLMSFKLTIGRVSILDIDAVHNEAIISIFPYCDEKGILQDYLFQILPIISQYGNSKNAIKGKTLNDTSICNMMIPLPPPAEQARIVEIIKEVTPLIDQYEQSWRKLEDLNKRFPHDLQKSILQMAIQGKLVDQDLAEGTGEELYNQIQNEKAKLIKNGIIKKEKDFNPIKDEEKPFDIPNNWTWARFGNLGSYKKGPFGSALTKSMFIPKGPNAIKVYEQKNAIQKDATLGEYYISKDYFESKMLGFEVHSGDIIVSCAGTIGEAYVLPDGIEQGIINQALMRMQIFEPLYIPYFLMFFDVVLKQNARAGSKGSAIKNIPPFEVLKNYLVPIPPLEEQKRIVAKLDDLQRLFERLN